MISRKILYGIILLFSTLFIILYAKYFPILLFIELIILPAVLVLILFINKRYLEVFIDKSEEIGHKNEETEIIINIDNDSILPTSKVDIYTTLEDSLGNIVEKIIRVSVDNNSRKRISYKFKPTRCGVVKIKISHIVIYDYFSIFSFKKQFNINKDLIVFPNIHIFSNEIFDKNSSLGKESEEFSEDKAGDDPSEIFDIREYMQGDKIQKVHWKLSSKFDELMVKEYSSPILTTTMILVELYVDRENSKAGSISDGLLEATYSISNHLLSCEYPHYLGWYDKNQGLIKREIITNEDLFEAIREMILAGIYDENYKALKEFISLKDKSKNHKLIYMCTESEKETINSIRNIGTSEDNQIVLLTSLEGEEVALDIEGNSYTNVVDIDSFEESLDRVII